MLLGGSIWATSTALAQDLQALATNRQVITDRVQLISVQENGDLVFQNEQNRHRTVPLEEFSWWNGALATSQQPLTYLMDGSVLAGQVRFLGSGQMEVSSLLWEPTTIPLSQVRSIQLQIPADRATRKRQSTPVEPRETRAQVWLTNGDLLAGDFSDSQSDGSLKLRNGEGIDLVPLSRVAAISFPRTGSPSSTNGEAADLEYSFQDGSRLQVNTIDFSQDACRLQCGFLSLSLPGPYPGDDPAEYLFGQVIGIRNLVVNHRFLSEPDLVDWQHTPFLGLETAYQFHRSINGHEIEFGNRRIPFGIGMSSRSSAVFRIDQPVETMQFQFGLAMDPSSGKRGSVVCSVLRLNAQDQWETGLGPTPIRGLDARAFFATLPLGDCRAVALTVNYDTEADVLDRVNWIMPRLIR